MWSIIVKGEMQVVIRENENYLVAEKNTSARNTSRANPLKQLITACWMSNPRLSKALIVESKRPGLRAQNMWMLTALPSLSRTSTYKIRNHS